MSKAKAKAQRQQNALQKIAEELAADLRPLYLEVAGYMRLGMSAEEALQAANYYEKATDKITSAVVVGATVGTAGTVFKIDVANYRKWYQQSKAGELLSDAIRSPQMVDDLKKILRDTLQFRKTALTLADTLNKMDSPATKSRLPKLLDDFITAYRTAPLDNKTKALARASEKYVQKLSGGPTQATKSLKNQYSALISQVKSGNLFENTLAGATNAKLRYINERIARTEIARGYESARYQSYKDDEGIIACQILLSPEHPVPDECDEVAEYDQGWGAGVYALEDAPALPIHPQCLCSSIPIRRVSGGYEGVKASEEVEEATNARGIPSELLIPKDNEEA